MHITWPLGHYTMLANIRPLHWPCMHVSVEHLQAAAILRQPDLIMLLFQVSSQPLLIQRHESYYNTISMSTPRLSDRSQPSMVARTPRQRQWFFEVQDRKISPSQRQRAVVFLCNENGRDNGCYNWRRALLKRSKT